jgi:hypothetical protein
VVCHASAVSDETNDNGDVSVVDEDGGFPSLSSWMKPTVADPMDIGGVGGPSSSSWP